MKRKFLIKMCLATFIGIFVCFSLLLWSFHVFFKDHAFNSLKAQSELIKQSLKYNQDDINYLNSLNFTPQDTRVIIVQPDGEVLFDSSKALLSTGNYYQRSEMTDAHLSLKSQIARNFPSFLKDTYYYSVLLNNDNVLSLSVEKDNILNLFYGAWAQVIFIIVASFIVCALLSKSLTRSLIKTIENLSENIDSPGNYNTYDELGPLVNKISAQNKKTKEQISALQSRKDALKTITANMKEGLILVNENKIILSVNKSAIVFLNAKNKTYFSLSILNLCRDPLLISCLNAALLGNSQSCELYIDENIYEVLLNPVIENNVIKGAVILMLDITQKKRVQKIKHDFSANVSHELRTPLTAISGFAEMIKNDMLADASDAKKFGSRIYDEAKRLITLIDDIMRLSRIEEKPEVDLELVDIFKICKAALTSLSQQILQKGINVSLIKEGRSTSLLANKRMMEEMVFNLLENSIKYNNPGGTIVISIKKSDRLVFSISDNGIGIPKKHQQRVFERFYRVNSSRSKASGGTGLGLSIVKHIVEHHHGEIELQSNIGKGTTISITI